MNWAVKERRIIVTTDNDFEEMIWRQGKPHCGVLRLENLPRSERIVLLRDVLDRYSRDLESGAKEGTFLDVPGVLQHVMARSIE